MAIPTTVEFFVPGVLSNPLNGPHGYWRRDAAYRKNWREKVFVCARAAIGKILIGNQSFYDYRLVVPTAPKTMTLMAYTWNTMDSHDGLRASLKPVVDGLVDAGLIDSDADSAGHTFVYTQAIRRKQRGVLIRVEPR